MLYPDTYLELLFGTSEDAIPAGLRAGTPAADVTALADKERLASEGTKGIDSLVFSWRESRPAHARYHTDQGCRIDVIATPKVATFAAARVLAVLNRDRLGVMLRRPILRRPGVLVKAQRAVQRVEWSVLLRDDDRNLPSMGGDTVRQIIFLPQGYQGAVTTTDDVHIVEAPGYAVAE